MEHFARQAHTKIKEDRAKGEGRTGGKKKKKGAAEETKLPKSRGKFWEGLYKVARY